MDVKAQENRHVCRVCKKKKTASKMVKIRSNWICNEHLTGGKEIPSAGPALESAEGTVQDVQRNPEDGFLKVLNLYAGIGGNRKEWTGVKVTSVENNLQVATAYKELYPNDTLVIADAHSYLLKHYNEFDVIWSSPPCPTHSRINLWQPFIKKRYPDLSLYQEILFLKSFFKGVWVVENVMPYYEPLIRETKKMARHMFWSNIKISDCVIDKEIAGFIECCNREDKQRLQEWLGIYYEKNIYLSGKNFCQVFKNCVHPQIGKSVFDDIIRHLKEQSKAPDLSEASQ